MAERKKKNELTKAQQKELAKQEKASAAKDALSNIMYWRGARLVKSDVEVGERLTEFFMRCEETGEIPTVEKMSLALGTYSSRVLRWEHGEGLLPHMTESTTEMIRRAKHVIAALDAELAMQNKTNSNIYIFRSKNYYGLRDQVETVVTTAEQTVKTPDQLMKRYGNVVDVDYERKEPPAVTETVEVVEPAETGERK